MNDVVSGLCGEHAALHGIMGAFNFSYVDESGGAADEGAAGEVELGDGLEATFGEYAGCVGEALA